MYADPRDPELLTMREVMAKKRQGKRSHLKRFASDFINVNRGPNPDAMAAYHHRSLSVVGGKSTKLPVFNNTFTQEIPPTKARGTHHIGPDGTIYRVRNLTPREELAAKQEQRRLDEATFTIETLHLTWQSPRHQGNQQFFPYLSLLKLEGYELKLFRSGVKHIFVEERRECTRFSLVYDTNASAMRAYNNNKILWQHKINSAP